MKSTIVTLLVALVVVNAVPLQEQHHEQRKTSLRHMLIHCLDVQAAFDESNEVDDSQFIKCLSRQLKDFGQVKILPGVILSSGDETDESGRAITTANQGKSIKLSLPWTNSTARWLGGWGSPSLVLSGDTTAMDVSVELNKKEDESRGKKFKKLLLPLMIGLKLKSALFGLLSYGAVAAIAGKALLVSIASLIVSAVIGMKKAYSTTWDHGHGTASHYSSYEPTSSYYQHGHRSYEPIVDGTNTILETAQVINPAVNANQLAYKSYNTQH